MDKQFNMMLGAIETKPTYHKHFKLTSLVMSIAWQGPDVMDSHIYPKTNKHNEFANKHNTQSK